MTDTEKSSLRDSIPTPWQMTGLPADTPVLLGLSGGADSRFLLDVLAEQSARDGFPILLAHVEHGIRGETSLRDRAFCESLAERYRLPIEVLSADVPALARQNGHGLEEEARAVRYAFFGRLMREKNIPILVTAHQADDNLETVLFRLCRGTGVRGLCGIPPVRRFADGFAVRPLLGVTKREILTCCQEEKLEYVEDETNADGNYARNRIRNEVVPILETLYPDPQKRVYRMTGALRTDLQYLESEADAFLQTAGTGNRLSREALLQIHVALRRRVLEKWVIRNGGAMPEAVHFDALDTLIERNESGNACSLPGGVKVRLCRGQLCIVPDERGAVLPYRIPFCVGKFGVPGTQVTVCVERVDGGTDGMFGSTREFLRIPKTVTGTLYWRPRRDGDRMLLHGVHRPVRRMYRDAGVIPDLRDRLPVLCDADGIVWVPFVGVRDGSSESGDGYRIGLTGLPGRGDVDR